MSCRLAAILACAALGALIPIGPASAQPPPPGYRLLTSPQASGGLLLAQRPAMGGATQLLVEGFREVASFFDRRPEALGGYADTQNAYAEAAFRATSRQTLVDGVAFATSDGRRGTIGFAFDTPNTLGQSLPRLVQQVGLSGVATPENCPPAPTTWRNAPYPDGSGQMVLPEGWTVTAGHHGMATAQGPHGMVESGLWCPAITRAGAAQRTRFGFSTLVPIVDPTDLSTALVGVWTHLFAVAQQAGAPLARMRRVIETATTPVQGFNLAQGGFAHYEIEEGGTVKRVLAYLTLGAVDGDGQWLYFESRVMAPLACFGQNLPTLVRIWTSAQVAPHELQRRLDAAMSSLREAQEIQWRAGRNRSAAHDAMFENWQETFRGTRVVEDAATGVRSTVGLTHSTELVRRLNRQEGYERYREVPARDLNR